MVSVWVALALVILGRLTGRVSGYNKGYADAREYCMEFYTEQMRRDMFDREGTERKEEGVSKRI